MLCLQMTHLTFVIITLDVCQRRCLRFLYPHATVFFNICRIFLSFCLGIREKKYNFAFEIQA